MAAAMTQVELARRTGTTPMQIWRFEKGHRPVTRAWAKRLAPELNIADPGQLVSRKSQKSTGAPKRRAQPDKGDSELVESDLERMLLRLWRSLPPEGKDVILAQIMRWAEARVRQRGLADPAATGQLTAVE